MNPDSLIFDMDGTLWDAVDTYAHCWTEVLKDNGIDKTLTRADIQKYMGMEAKQIYREIFPDLPEETIEKLYTDIIAKTDEVLPKMGGMIYPEVQNCIKILSTKYKLFMLSNCQKGSIRDFMNYTDTNDYFIDYIEYGSNFQPKNVNIRTLMERYDLKAPVYVGDTDSDRKQADLAYIPFVFAAWGFGKTHFYKYKFDNMQELTEYFMNLGNGSSAVINNDIEENDLNAKNREDGSYAITEDAITEEELKELEKTEQVEIIESIEDLKDEMDEPEESIELKDTTDIAQNIDDILAQDSHKVHQDDIYLEDEDVDLMEGDEDDLDDIDMEDEDDFDEDEDEDELEDEELDEDDDLFDDEDLENKDLRNK